MKVTVYLRVARGARGPRVHAGTSPNYEPLKSGSGWNEKPLPTAAFALELVIPDEALDRASQVLASLEIPDEQIDVAAAVTRPEDDA